MSKKSQKKYLRKRIFIMTTLIEKTNPIDLKLLYLRHKQHLVNQLFRLEGRL